MTDFQATDFNWDSLINRILNGKVIPVIGEDLYTVLLPGGKETLLYSYLAKELAREAGYDLQLDSDHLFAKAAFAFLKNSGDPYALQTFLLDRIKKVSLSPSSRLHKLASIRPFELIINTTYDDFLAEVQGEVRDYPVKSFDYSRKQKSVLEDLNNALAKASQSPLSIIFNIYGNLRKIPEESAFGESDIQETIIALQEDFNRGQQQAHRLYVELSLKALLFIGCGYDDWLFRFFMRTISTRASGDIGQPNFFGNNFKSFTQSQMDNFLKTHGESSVWLGENNDFIDEIYERIGREDPNSIIQPDEFPNTAFISFDGKDRLVAMRLAESLRKDGIIASVDSREVHASATVDITTINAITKCKAFIPLISENSMQIRATKEGLKYHIQEWEWVHIFNSTNTDEKKLILPIVIDGTNRKYSPFKNSHHLHIPNGDPVGDYPKLRDILRIHSTFNIPLPKRIEKISKQKTVRESKKLLKKNRVLPLKEVKILVVGDGGAGKTSFVKRLLKQKFDENEKKTPGININSWSVKPESRKIEIQTHIWDFGGQEIMHATHQFFLSKRSLYILVLDGRKEEKSEYWLKYIESFGGDSPILVILNKLDLNPNFEVNRLHLKEKYENLIDFHRISCKTGDGMENLIPVLEKTLLQVEFLNIHLKSNWLHVKNRLVDLEFPYISHTEFQKLCEKEEITEELEQLKLVRFLNDLGIILHYEDFDLKDTYVLEPNWVTKGVYKIINSNLLAEGKGILRLSDLEKILAGGNINSSRYPTETHRYIVDLMKKFELCFLLEQGSVLIPNLLDVEEKQFDFDYDNALKFIYQYDFLPKSIIPRLIVRMNRDIKNNLCWRSGVVLVNESYQTMAAIKEDEEEKRIHIYVVGEQKKAYFTIIRHAISDINDSFEKLEISELVPLTNDNKITLDYDELVGLEEMGEEYVPIGKLGKRFNVKKLLDGIEEEKERITHSPDFGKANILNINKYIVERQEVDKMSSSTVNITDSTVVNANIVAAKNIENSNIIIKDSQAPDELKNLLKQLTESVTIMVEQLSDEQKEQVTDDLQTFTKEATKKKPRQDWWQLSAKGLKEAAKTVGEIGVSVLTNLDKIIPILEKMV